MSFLAPLYLLGALAIALPLVLHLLRRDVAPQVPFTAVRLLRVSPVDRSRKRRLRDLILLTARIVALVLLAAAFARPYVTGAAGRSGATVIAIDRSFSMGAPGVFARALDQARAAIDDASGAGDRVAVVAFDDRAAVAAPPGSAADARSALGGLTPGNGGTRYAAALEKAADLLREDRRGRVVVVGDLQRSGFDGAAAVLPDSVALVVKPVEGPSANVAVTDARTVSGRPVATIRNFGTSAVSTRARLEVDGRPVAARPAAIPAASAVDVAFALSPPARGFAIVVDDTAGYTADNRRFATTASGELPRVLIAGGGPVATAGFFLSRALAAGDEGPEFDVRTVTGTTFASMSIDELKRQSVVALMSTHGLDRRVRETLRGYLDAGGGILIAAAPDVDASVLSALLDWQPALAPRDTDNAGVLAVSDMRHPIFKPFEALSANLGQIEFRHVWGVLPGRAWRMLARFTDGAPALLERSAGAGRILLFTSDLDRRWNDFPLHPAFVPFAQEAVRYLGARAALAGSCTVADVPAGVRAEPGIATAGSRTIAVNVDVRESSLDRVSPEEFARLVTRAAAAARPAAGRVAEQAEARQGYWRYGLMLMLAVLVAEAFVGSR